MELKFKSTGSTAGFVTWLKGFKDILPSLLIEVDLESNEFIAKSFPPQRSIVKYSKISFEDAGFELSSLTDNSGEAFDWANRDASTSGRIKLGIFQILGKFIDVENMFSETDHEMIVKFDICKNVVYMHSSASEAEYQGESITLKSLSLTMVIKCSELSEFFEKCDDNTFLNRVCNIGSPSVYEVNSDTLVNLSKISSVFAADKSRDTIKFYSKVENGQRALYAFDESNGSYDYLLGYYVDGEDGNTSTKIFKENFLNATKGITSETLRITLDTAGASRILVDADSSKVVIAAVQNN